MKIRENETLSRFIEIIGNKSFIINIALYPMRRYSHDNLKFLNHKLKKKIKKTK